MYEAEKFRDTPIALQLVGKKWDDERVLASSIYRTFAGKTVINSKVL